MATVTSFTAERMLQIENTTVVDGEVVGDNLHLLQRDGTPIDAGNVRGPQGIQGPPGQDGTNGQDGVGIPVGGTIDQYLRKQSSTNYDVGWKMPDFRIFANKAALDAWTTAPEGAYAYTVDTKIEYRKISGVWEMVGGYVPWRVIGSGGQPGFVNGWTNNGSYASARFRKICDRLDIWAAIAGGATGTHAWVLPTDCRPLSTWTVPMTAYPNGHGLCQIIPDGRVQPFFEGGATMFINGSVSTI